MYNVFSQQIKHFLPSEHFKLSGYKKGVMVGLWSHICILSFFNRLDNIAVSVFVLILVILVEFDKYWESETSRLVNIRPVGKPIHMSEHIHVAWRTYFLVGPSTMGKCDESFCVSFSLMGDCEFVRITYFIEYRPRHSWHILKQKAQTGFIFVGAEFTKHTFYLYLA